MRILLSLAAVTSVAALTVACSSDPSPIYETGDGAAEGGGDKGDKGGDGSAPRDAGKDVGDNGDDAATTNDAGEGTDAADRDASSPADGGSDAGGDGGADGSALVDAGNDAGTPDATTPADSGSPDATVPADAGTPDAAAPIDSGTPDATVPADAGTPDAATPVDSGSPDATVPADAGSPDAAAPVDAGKDSGPVDAGPADSGISNADACAQMATAYCAVYTRCSPNFAVQFGFGTTAKCIERTQLACESRLSARGSKMDAAWATGCAAAAPSLTCANFAVGNFGACATPPGTLANGQACAEDGQCSSTFCARAADATCGACAPLSTSGSACAASDKSACSVGFLCDTNKLTCAPLKAGKAGSACTTNADCDIVSGVGCGFRTCVQAQLANDGENCGISFATASITVCSGAGSCRCDGNNCQTTCHPASADGQACTAGGSVTSGSTGQTCMGPAVCQGSVCTEPNAAACN